MGNMKGRFIMKKSLKRVLATAVAVSTISSTAFLSANAYVWYSDNAKVGYYSEVPTIGLQHIWTTSTFTTDKVRNMISAAALQWKTNPTYPIPNDYITGGGKISVVAGKPSTITKNENVSLKGSNGSVLNGLTRIFSSSSGSYSITVNGVSKEVRNVTRATVYFANKQSGGTYVDTTNNNESISYTARSDIGHQNTLNHEIGHALGYYGHSTYSGDLMASSTSNTSQVSVSIRDRTHIGQFVPASLLTYSDEEIPEDDIQIIPESLLLSTESKAELIKNSTGFANNVIVGTPIEVVQGSDEVLPLSEEDCVYLMTEYKFRVSNYLYGNGEDEIITVRSQVGNIFELGHEYTFSADRINNTLYDTYTVNSRRWVIDNSETSDDMLISLNEDIASIPMPYNVFNNEVVEYASFSDDFVNQNVDVAVVATISAAEYDEENQVYDISVSDVNFIKGTASEEALNNVRIRGDINVGETYLMMFDKDEDETLMISSRNGSIIKADSAAAAQFEDILESY